MQQPLISPEDRDLLLNRWHLSSTGYFQRTEGGKTIKMHRVILARMIGRQLLRGEEVDHINMVRSDNRRENLRVATRSENVANSPKRAGATSSRFKGVSYDRYRKKWQAQGMKNYKRRFLGRFTSERAAALAYNKWAVRVFGEFATLNDLDAAQEESRGA